MQNQSNVQPGYSSAVWQFFASIKFTVVLLLCLALLSVIGTVVPQNAAAQEYIRLYGISGYRIFVLLNIVDMYHAWWFLGLLLLLALNIIVCSIDRLQKTAKIIFVKHPQFNLQKFKRYKNRQEFKTTASIERLEPVFKKYAAKHFHFHRVTPFKDGFAVVAEKGRWTRLGVYGLHLSIVVLLMGALLGSLFGFEGFVAIPEGEAADTIQMPSGRQMKLPFTIRCDDFDVQFYAGGQRPKEFKSSLTLLKDGRELVHKDIVVNDPLHFQGIGIYQSTYGRMDDQAALASAANPQPQEIELQFQSVSSGMVYERSATLGLPVKIPENLGQLILESYEPQAQYKGMDIGPAFMGSLTAADGRVQSVTLPLKFPKFDFMRKGQVVITVKGQQAASQPERYYTGLQVAHDPGVGVVYAGFILMIAGCAVVFFMSHQQMVIEVNRRSNGVVVAVSGTANKNKMGFDLKLQRIVAQLSSLAQKSTKPVDNRS